MLYKGMTITIFEPCILIKVHILILHTDIYMYNYMKLPHIYYPLIQNKYLTLQTGRMLTIVFLFWWNTFLG